ncbi:MAG: hypothetical protein JWR00_4138, partial [Rubritepida sp.]|nr:hypothetical protein [Rubritepida sp.]
TILVCGEQRGDVPAVAVLAQSGLGLEAQQASVRAFVASQGWTLVSSIPTSPAGRTTGGLAFRRRC